jgi:trigger factor
MASADAGTPAFLEKTVALVEGVKHSLEISVPVSEVEQETERVVSEIQKKVRLPGFRPGKAPVSLVKSRFGGDIRQDVLEKLVPKAFRAAVDKDHLEVVGAPDISDVHFHAGEPLKFKAAFEVAPTFDLKDYRGILVNYTEPEVSDEDIAKRLEEIREQKAEYVNEDPRPLADGDFAMVSLESLSGVSPKISQDEIMLKIGDESTLAAFSENLRGASPEESREFDVTYPADYERKNLAGRTVRFRTEVKAVRRRELPELNDEFAKDLGDYQTLEEVKEMVRKSIQRDREVRAQEAAKHQLIDKLVDEHDFPIPNVYVDRQIEINVENQLRTLAAQGIDPKSIKLDWNKVRETQKGKAERDVKASLLLDKVGERESIAATQEEVDKEVQRIARQQREAVAVTRAKLQKEGALGRIAAAIRTEKTLNFLFEHARKEAGAGGEESEDRSQESE